MKDGRGKITRYEYGDFSILLKVINPEDKTIEYSYDLHGNIGSMKDKNQNTTQYKYNTMDRVTKKSIEGSEESISFEYDVMGNRTRMEDESGTSEYTYDENNRLLEIIKNGEREITYTYDKSNRMKTVTNKSDTTTYTYDKNNKILILTNKKGLKELSRYEYSYDKASRQNSKTDSYGTTTYTYDKVGRIKKIAAPGKTVAYS